MVTDGAEGDRLLEYLASGSPVLHTTARTRDVLDPAAGQFVPTSWQAGSTDAETDQETAIEAANFLLYPPPEYAREAARTPGASG